MQDQRRASSVELALAVGLCPWGGDEFAVLAPNTAPDPARTLATRLLDQMTQQVSTNRIATASIEVATFDLARNASVTADSFMRKADAALYGAKTGGGHHVRVS